MMPPLPKQNKKLEADFGIKLKAYIEKNPFKISTGIELKQTETDSIPFSAVEPQQVAHGLRTKSDKGVWIRVQGTNGEQDYIWLVNTPSYVAIKFKSGTCFIDIETFVLERDRSKRKSLTWERAKEIALREVKL